MKDVQADRPLRRIERVPFQAAVQFRKGHSRVTVKIIDISVAGARLSAIHVLRKGDLFWLKLPKLAPQEAMVMWSDNFVVGCQFIQPLHPAVLRELLNTA